MAPRTVPPGPPGRPAVLALALVAAAAGCRSPQRVPGPMEPARGVSVPEARAGSEVLVLRHSDPVLIQRAGAAASFPMAFYRKRERVGPGGRVSCGGGGRAEILWPGDASSVVLFDGGMVRVGDVDHDEPLVTFLDVTRARLVLTPEDRVELVGGAVLRGDPARESGPFLVERLGRELLRVSNHSKQDARVLFRDDALDLRSGDALDLPVLAEGARPRPVDPDRIELQAEGFELQVLGTVRPETEPGRVRLVAEEKTEVSLGGLRVLLDPGDEVVFSDLAPRRPAAPAPAPPSGAPPPPSPSPTSRP